MHLLACNNMARFSSLFIIENIPNKENFVQNLPADIIQWNNPISLYKSCDVKYYSNGWKSQTILFDWPTPINWQPDLNWSQ